MKEFTSDLQQVTDVFVKKLLKWNLSGNDRTMPWKGEKDPYKIWLSEIILQQTRVEQGLKYYENFIKAFPSIHDLAKAPAAEVYKLWEGLGYYTRCRNLIHTAQFISRELKGRFPANYSSLLGLRGVGPYTAAAIASFAYQLPYAVLDGNVFRVLSRILDCELPIDSVAGKRFFSETAQKMLPAARAGEYNQAIMDFGAVICKPVPECGICFFRKDCRAFLQNKQHLVPVKEKKTKIKDRWLNYVLVRWKDEIAIRQRTGRDIWQQLYELVLIETEKSCSENGIAAELQKHYHIKGLLDINSFRQITQKLSHQTIHFSFATVLLLKKQPIEHYQWVPVSSLNQLAFPKTLKEYIEDTLPA